MRRGLRKIARCYVSAVVVVITMALSSLPAHASVSGGGQFQAAVTIAPDPCAGQCLTTFSGWFRGAVGGFEVGGALYTATFPNPSGGVAAAISANLSGSSSVTDSCPLGDTLPALTESATGTFTASGGALVDSRGNVLEQGITLAAGWQWTGVVVGSAVVDGIETSAATVSDSAGHVIATGLIGAGSATFTPTPPYSIGTCATPGTSVGVIAGSLGEPA